MGLYELTQRQDKKKINPLFISCQVVVGFPLKMSWVLCWQNWLCRRACILSPHPGTCHRCESIYLVILSITLPERSVAILKNLGERNRSDQRLGEQEIQGEAKRMRLIQSREKDIQGRQPQKNKTKGELWRSSSPFLSPETISAVSKSLPINIALTCSSRYPPVHSPQAPKATWPSASLVSLLKYFLISLF